MSKERKIIIMETKRNNLGTDILLKKYNLKRFVNEENKTVTLKINPYRRETEKLFCRIASKLGLNKGLSECLLTMSPYVDYNNSERFEATAKCSPADTFNVDTGTRVAFEKLQNKFARNLMSAVEKVYKDSADVINKIDETQQLMYYSKKDKK